MQVALEVRWPLRTRSPHIPLTRRVHACNSTTSLSQILLQPTGRDGGTAQQFLREVLAEALLAEALGFNSVWVPEHHFGLFGCLPTPAVFLAHVAAKTTRIKLAPATVLLPCNQPLRVAEEYAMLDLLSDGRAIFSAGRGYDKREYDAFAIPFDESRARFDEEMQLVPTAWTEEEFTFAGTFHQVREPLTVLPRPVQQPHPPIYVACFSRPTVEMAARSGFNAIFAPFAATMMFRSLQEAPAQFKALAREAGYPHSKVMSRTFSASPILPPRRSMPKSACCTTCRAFYRLSRMTDAQRRHTSLTSSILSNACGPCSRMIWASAVSSLAIWSNVWRL